MANASGLTPVNDCLVVELGGQYKNIQVKEGKYDTQDNGVVIASPAGYGEGGIYYDWVKDVVGKRVWWAPMKEGTRVERNGKLYAFIDIDDVQGVEHVETV